MQPRDQSGAVPPVDEDHEPFEMFENSLLGHEYRLLERGTDESGEYLLTEVRFRSDARHFDEHVHLQQDESWRVISGTLVVTVDGEEHALSEGEHITVPKGTPHVRRTPSETETRVLNTLRPPGNVHGLLRSLATLAEEGRTAEDGTPGMVQAAVIFDTYPGTYETGIPITVQRWLFKLLAPLGRRVDRLDDTDD